ncbi:MAG: hypothetical protein KBT46_08555 [Ruminococcus sp.]|nr:hypothetical protein [Candidatus Copronaster equi]
MGTKILSIILSVIMVVMTTIFPGFTMPGTETVETGDFLAQVDAAFGYNSVGDVGEVYGLNYGDEYYDAVATASEYDVLVDYTNIDVTEAVKPEFVATVLVTAAQIDCGEITIEIKNAGKVAHLEKVAAAAANGIITLDALGRVALGAMDAADVTAAIDKAVELYTAITPETEMTLADGVKTVTDYEVVGDTIVVDGNSDLEVGDTYVLEQSDAVMTGGAYKVDAIEEVNGEKVVKNSEVAIEDVIEKINYEGSTDVDFATAMIADGNGAVINDGVVDANGISKDDIIKTLKKLANVSFSVKGFKVKAKITDTGLDFSISKSVCNGVTLAKSYSLSNLSVDAKADVNIKKLNFNNVYLNFDYDLVDTTSITGSYAKVFGDEVVSEGAKIDSDKKVAELVNKYILSACDSSSIKLFTFTLPLGTTPLTVTFDVLLNIGVNGKMEIVVVSHESYGVSIINNKLQKPAHSSQVLDRSVNIYGDFQVCLGLDVALGLYGYNLVDVGVEGGLGAKVNATLKVVNPDGTVAVDSTLTVPVDYLVELAAGADFDGTVKVGGHADIYGILRISVGTNSVISKIGLKKTWTIFDNSNGKICEINF